MSSALSSLFLWFYCLPLEKAAMFAALATTAFLLLRERFGGRWLWRVSVGALLLAWLAGMLWSTVLGRGGGESQGVVLIPLHSYWTVLRGGEIELLRTNFMNLLLFYPAGLLLVELLPRRWTVLLKILVVVMGCALLSAAVELSQCLLVIGRTEVDDVIHNAIGAGLGCWLAVYCRK